MHSFLLSRLTLIRVGLLTGGILLLGLGGCAGLSDDVTKGWSLEKLHQEAKDEVANGGFDKAAGLYEKLETRAIGTPLAQQAQVEKAYAQYKAGEQVQAVVTLDRFMRLHPASPLMDYALYLKGLVNFNDNLGFLNGLTKQDLSERDQKAAKESYQTFADLTSRFPNSKYSPDAQLRMSYILNSLASYEVHVAKYYVSRGAYLAAANRAQTAIQEYPKAPVIEEALAILIRSYDALNLVQLRDDAKRVMAANFPRNKLAAASQPLQKP